MAYFLKKTLNKKGTYLQIYESFYEPKRGHTAHRSYRAIGYVHELIESGIDDPISFFKKEVDMLNEQRKAAKNKEKELEISDESPEKFLGHFLLKNINDNLGVKKYLDLMQSVTGFKFNLFSLISALVYSRVVAPCSKLKTFEEVIPKLFEKYDFSLNQIYSGLEYMGLEYEKIIEIYNHQIKENFSVDTSTTYFDCTNFYFEIDREDDFRKKGPSKENRTDPIVGMGLLLDANQIPLGMKLFPGNQSEKPVLRDIINDLKKRNNISGRTIQVADKGLNCSDNIINALKSGDGYIFSKSVKQLPEIEKTWILLSNDYKSIIDCDGNILYKVKECVEDFPYVIKTSNGKKKTVMLREKRVAIYNPKLAEKQKLEIYKLIEKAKILKACHAKKIEYGDCSKFVTFSSTDKDGNKIDTTVSLNEKTINKSLALAGYNLIITSEINMKASEVYSTYHNLWKIEESFKIMKSQLDARPVYLQKKNTIVGHFLICYISVLLTRLLQSKILNNQYSSEKLFDFFRNFNVAKVSSKKYINLAKRSDFMEDIAHKLNLPLLAYFLTNTNIAKILGNKL